MPNSLRSKLSKLRYKRQISDEEYKELTDKLRGHDKELLAKIKAEIESMDFDFGDYYDHTDEIIEMVCKAIDKYKTEGEET